MGSARDARTGVPGSFAICVVRYADFLYGPGRPGHSQSLAVRDRDGLNEPPRRFAQHIHSRFYSRPEKLAVAPAGDS